MIRESIDGLVCDLDGVMYRGSETVPGAAEAIEGLRAEGIKVLFCTNNSRSTPTEHVKKLTQIGVPVEIDDILTSAMVTAEVLSGRAVDGMRALAIGGQGLTEALASIGVEVLDAGASESADIVAIGWDPAFGYGDMTRAMTAVRDGAVFVATNDDASFPAPGGRLIPGAGAILASIERASGRSAEVMGKPHTPMLEAARKRFRLGARLAAVGDRPETDLAGATKMGWRTILVLSGVTDEPASASIEPRPDLVLPSIAQLIED